MREDQRRTFRQRPFVAGSLIGMRAFKVDDEGALRGPLFPVDFKVGVNSAACLDRYMFSDMTMPSIHHYSLTHTVGQMGCSCGFYAYFAGENKYAHDLAATLEPRIEGIVEGSGVCTVGSRGFRASKLQIIALVKPDTVPKRLPLTRSDKLSVASTAWCAVFGVWDTFGPLWWLGPILGLIAAANLATLILARRARRRASEINKLPVQGWEKVRVRYPDVPVYDSLDAALAEHPLTVPEKAVAS